MNRQQRKKLYLNHLFIETEMYKISQSINAARNTYLLIGILICLVFNSSALFSQRSSEEIEKTVVRIGGSDNQLGTGFVFCISEEKIAYIMTAYHVVKDFDIPGRNIFKVEFTFSDKSYTASVRWFHDKADLAILSLEKYPRGLKTLMLGDSKGITAGTGVYICGYPGGDKLQIDNGSIRYSSGNKIFLDDITPNKGNSGGPLLCAETNIVIGIIVQKSNDPTEQYAIKINEIKTFIEDIEILRSVISSATAISCNGQVREGSDRRLINSFGLRIGKTFHYQPKLFLGKESSWYFEIFLSYIIPELQFRGLTIGFEPSIGLNRVKPEGLFRGVIAANGFFNLKAVYSGVDYLHIPLIFSTGIGVGGQGINYNFNQGEGDYVGENSLDRVRISFATNLFIELEFPITEKLQFQCLFRWIPKSKEIEFKDVGEYFGKLYDPKGNLGGFYLIGGLEYIWH